MLSAGRRLRVIKKASKAQNLPKSAPQNPHLTDPKGPCTQIVYTSGPMYRYREYFKAKVYTIWVHGPLG